MAGVGIPKLGLTSTMPDDGFPCLRRLNCAKSGLYYAL